MVLASLVVLFTALFAATHSSFIDGAFDAFTSNGQDFDAGFQPLSPRQQRRCTLPPPFVNCPDGLTCCPAAYSNCVSLHPQSPPSPTRRLTRVEVRERERLLPADVQLLRGGAVLPEDCADVRQELLSHAGPDVLRVERVRPGIRLPQDRLRRGSLLQAGTDGVRPGRM